MNGGRAGTMADEAGTNRGRSGMNGAQRRIALGFALGFAAMLDASQIQTWTGK
jgi:hypothetical protein